MSEFLSLFLEQIQSPTLGFLIGGIVVYGVLKITMGLKMSQEEEYEGADLTVHKISAQLLG